MLLGHEGYRVKPSHIEWLRPVQMVMESERAAGEGETEEVEMHNISQGSKEKGPASSFRAHHRPVKTLPAEKKTAVSQGTVRALGLC